MVEPIAQPGLHGFGGRTGYSISRQHLTSPQLSTEWLSSVMSSATVLNYRYVFSQNSNGTDLYQLVFLLFFFLKNGGIIGK